MVRKRKNSEDNAVAASAAAAPLRPTRQNSQRRILDKQGDPDSTVMEKSIKSSRMPKTPSTGQRTTRKKKVTANEEVAVSTRSRRAPAMKSSSDSDIENRSEDSSKEERSARRKLNDVESYPTRSRTKKDFNATITQDSTVMQNENGVETSFAEPKRQTKKKRILMAADNTLTEDSNSPKNGGKLTRSQAKSMMSTKINSLLNPQELEIETLNKRGEHLPAVIKNLKNSATRRIVETPKKVSPRRESNSFRKISNNTITPESSPMLVNLTPSRSSKTPRKSPMNIGSPKTHSQSPLRLSKTPRKLPVAVESPATSDKSSISVLNQSSTDMNPQRLNLPDPFVVLTDFVKEDSLRNDKSISEIDNSTRSPPSFISSIKLELKKPRTSPDLDSTKKSNNSSFLTVNEIWAQVSAVSPTRKSSPLNKKPTTLASKILRKSPASATINKKTNTSTFTFATPTKKRLSSATPGRTPATTPVNVKPLSMLKPESPRRPKSTTKKRSPFTSSGTPLRPVSEKKQDNAKSSCAIPSPCIIAPKKIKILLEHEASSPYTTPRGRIRKSLNLTPDFIKFSSDSTSSPIETPNRKSTRIKSPLTFQDPKETKMRKDESLELIDISNLINDSDDVFTDSVKPLDGTYELDKDAQVNKEKERTGEALEKTEVDNATYELVEPKTLSLTKISRKRSISNVEPDNSTPEAKKRCRVRFANPAIRETTSGIASPLRSTRKTLPTFDTPAKERSGGRLSSRRSVGTLKSRRSRSLTKINEKSTDNRISAKRRSISASNLTKKSTPKFNQSIQNSVNRLSRPRQNIGSDVKLDIKLPVAKKVPNFAQIHQRKFAEMESLVDAKKRVAKRHEALNSIATPLASSTRASQASSTALPDSTGQQNLSKKQKPAPIDPQKVEFNRFGFRLRKAEAVKMISKNPPAVIRSKNHQESNRSILKGVRTNKRFELQMKMRNIKP